MRGAARWMRRRKTEEEEEECANEQTACLSAVSLPPCIGITYIYTSMDVVVPS